MNPSAPPVSDNRVQEIAPDALGRALDAGNFEMLRPSGLRFDVERLVGALERVRARFPLRLRNHDPSYRGICLQSSRDTDDPLYGLVNLRPSGARPATEPTAIAGEFAHVFETLAPHLAFDRGRLLEIHPGHRMPFHSDGAGSRRLHIAITTSPSCFLDFEAGGSYHLPADGSCFLANTERPHRARNLSSAPRVHLVFQVRSLAAARDARDTPKLRARITRRLAPAQIDLADLRPRLAGLDWQHANHRYVTAGRILSRDTELASDRTTFSLVTEFATLEDLGEFLREGALERLGGLLAEKGYRLETDIT